MNKSLGRKFEVGVEDAERKSRNGRVEGTVTTTTRTYIHRAEWPSATLLKRRKGGIISPSHCSGLAAHSHYSLSFTLNLRWTSFLCFLQSSSTKHRPAFRHTHSQVPHRSRSRSRKHSFPTDHIEPLQTSPTCPVPPSRSSRVGPRVNHHSSFQRRT